MSLGVDPFVASLLFSAGLAPHASRLRAPVEEPAAVPEVLPFVSVIVALYREKPEDIEMTLRSLADQSYAKDRFEVLLVVEADDNSVKEHAGTGVNALRGLGISSKIVVSDGVRPLKAYALNAALRQARGEFCAFYDASDDIESTQMERAVSLMVQSNYDAVQATVLRKGRSILSELLLIDTVFWFGKYLPFLLGFARGMPLSGEGLFVRTSVLNEVGGFPEVLTEDAYLGIVLAERNKRFGLVSSVITEKAPKNLRAHFVQRLRWNRGYLTCLLRLLRSSMPVKRKCALMLPFLAPMSCSLALWGWILIVVHWLAAMSGSATADFTLMAAPHSSYEQFIFYWSLLLFGIGIPLCVLSYAHTLWVLGKRKSVPLLIFLPYYWTFIGVAATCSFFKSTRHWGKTER